MREPVRLKTRLGAVMGEGSAPEPEPVEEAPARPEPAPVAEASPTPPKPTARGAVAAKRQRITLWVSPEVCDAFRDAIYACPKQVTSADVAEEALQWAIRELQNRYSDGQPFPPRPEEAQQLPRGRPVR